MKNTALLLAGLVFAIVAAGHFSRFAMKWDFIIADWNMPLSTSLYAGLVTAGLSVFMFLARRN